MGFGYGKCTIFTMKNGKKEPKEGIKLAYQECVKTLGEKESDYNLGILEPSNIKQAEMKKKRLPQKTEKTSWKQPLKQKSCQKNKKFGSLPCKILRNILLYELSSS